MVGIGFDDEVVDQTRSVQRTLGQPAPRGDPLIERAVQTQDGDVLGSGEIGASGSGP